MGKYQVLGYTDAFSVGYDDKVDLVKDEQPESNNTDEHATWLFFVPRSFQIMELVIEHNFILFFSFQSENIVSFIFILSFD